MNITFRYIFKNVRNKNINPAASLFWVLYKIKSWKVN